MATEIERKFLVNSDLWREGCLDRKRLIWFSLRHRGLKASKEIDRERRRRLSST